MEWTDDRRDLTDETVDAFLRSVDQDGRFFLERLGQDQNRLSRPDEAQLLAGVESELARFILALTTLVELDQRLGFTANTGMRGEIDRQGSHLLQQVSFLAIVQQAFTATREAERSFLFDPSDANLAFLRNVSQPLMLELTP